MSAQQQIGKFVLPLLKRLGLVSATGTNAAALGPSSSTDNAIARYDGTTGKLLQSSPVTIADTTGLMTTGQGRVPVVLTRSVTSAQTGANTNETTLWSYSLPAGTLASDGQMVRIRAWGTTAANTNSKTIRLYFGSTNLRSAATTTSGVDWCIEAVVARTGATAQTSGTQFMLGSSSIAGAASPAETLSGAVTIALKAQNGVATADDITFRGAIVEFLP